MLTPWHKAWLKLFPPPVDDVDHDEEIHEAERAIEDSQQRQVEVAELGRHINRTAHRLRTAGERNHFSELVQDMLRESHHRERG